MEENNTSEPMVVVEKRLLVELYASLKEIIDLAHKVKIPFFKPTKTEEFQKLKELHEEIWEKIK